MLFTIDTNKQLCVCKKMYTKQKTQFHGISEWWN